MSQNVEMDIDERAFKKPKRELTDKQREALARGRAKAKEKRMAKLKENAEIEATRELKAIEKKNAKKTRKEQALEKVKYNSRKKKVDEFNNHKYRILESLSDEKDFNELSSALDTIDEDMMNDRPRLEKYLTDMISANNHTHAP